MWISIKKEAHALHGLFCAENGDDRKGNGVS